MRLRRQFYQLASEDLEKYPVWVHVMSTYESEEDELPEDTEGTVTPYPDPFDPAQLLDPRTIQTWVKADFMLADGSHYLGYIKSGSVKEFYDCAICLEQGQVDFYSGIRPPTREEMRADYQWFKKTVAQVFPIYYKPAVAVVGNVSEGVLEGFYYLVCDEAERKVKWLR